MSTPITPNLPNLPTDADLDAVAAEQKAKDATTAPLADFDSLVAFVQGKGYSAEAAKGLVGDHAEQIRADMQGEQASGKIGSVISAHPQATAPAHPEVEVQTSAPGTAPESLPNPTSHGHGEKGGPTAPSLDTEVFDDAGSEKTDQGIGDEGFGPRGHNIPRDVMSDAERQQQADDAEAKLKAGLAPTNTIDSTGARKGAFQVTPQGRNEHGMRLPDKIDFSKPTEPVAPHVGPRGVGAPQDCFHGPRPEKK